MTLQRSRVNTGGYVGRFMAGPSRQARKVCGLEYRSPAPVSVAARIDRTVETSRGLGPPR